MYAAIMQITATAYTAINIFIAVSDIAPQNARYERKANRYSNKAIIAVEIPSPFSSFRFFFFIGIVVAGN